MPGPNTKATDWTTAIVEQIEKPPDHIFGYRVPCKGDSGSGQIFSTIVNEFRFVIAAVLAGYDHDDVVDSNGKLVDLPCGTYSFDVVSNKFLDSVHFSQSVRWPPIFDWIKENMEK